MATVTLSRADAARRNAHPADHGRHVINSWSGVVLATRRLWDALQGEPGRCPECLWIFAEWGHNPDCPKRSRRAA